MLRHFANLDALQAEIAALRPLAPEDLERAMQRLRLEWTYHSNAIEGNSLDYGETRALLMHGVTAHGKPLKDHLDIQRHRDVIGYLERFVASEEPLTLSVVRGLHRMLMGETYEVKAQAPDGGWVTREEQGGAYKTHPNHVVTRTGEIHYYATPEDTPARMTDLMDGFDQLQKEVEAGMLHPLVAAATLHHGLVEIHPFADGNGRLARAVMNLLLMRAHFPPVVVRTERRDAYFGALSEADGGGDLTAFATFVAEEMEATLRLYLRALRNEPDPDAFRRRVALLRREAQTSTASPPMDQAARTRIGQTLLLPLLDETDRRADEVQPLFGQVERLKHAVDEEGRAYFGDAALNLLAEGRCVNFRPHWHFKGLRVDPHTSLLIAYEGAFGDDTLSLRLLPPNQVVRFEPGSTYGSSDALRLADQAFEQMMTTVERIVRGQS